MKKKINFLITVLSFLLITSCGFKIIDQSKLKNFKIQDIIVKAGSITSAFFLIFKASKANCSAVVPLLTEIANFAFNLWANLLSNFLTKGPEDEINPSFMHFCKYFFSFPCRYGSLTGTLNFILSIYMVVFNTYYTIDYMVQVLTLFMLYCSTVERYKCSIIEHIYER